MRRAARLGGLAATTAVLAVAAAAAAWKAEGGSWYVVATASMGTAAPVGTLVIDAPPGRLRVGELITFHPPGSSRTFTHRIVALTPDGGIETRGDIDSAADGWILTRRDVVGAVETTVRYAGWLLRALPILVLGIAVVWLLTRLAVDDESRLVARASGALVVVIVAIVIVRPLIGSAIITFAHRDGRAVGAVVSTGILPLEVTAVGGTSAVISDGQVARVRTRHVDAHGKYLLSTSPDWEWWWMVPMLLLTLVPGCLSMTAIPDPVPRVLAPERDRELDLATPPRTSTPRTSTLTIVGVIVVGWLALRAVRGNHR